MQRLKLGECDILSGNIGKYHNPTIKLKVSAPVIPIAYGLGRKIHKAADTWGYRYSSKTTPRKSILRLHEPHSLLLAWPARFCLGFRG